MSSEVYDAIKAAFIETREAAGGGVNLTFNGVTKPVLAPAIETSRKQMISQSMIGYGATAELLNEEFAAFGEIVEESTEGTISGLNVVVVAIATDELDPVTRLSLRAAR